MPVTLHLRICGALLILLAALHPMIARRFRWNTELNDVSLFTRQVFWVHTFFICVVLVQFGVLSLIFAPALLEDTLLAKLVLTGFVAFWGLRLLVQQFVYSPVLWRGNRVNTIAHMAFTVLWSYLVAVYAFALAHHFGR